MGTVYCDNEEGLAVIVRQLARLYKQLTIRWEDGVYVVKVQERRK